MSPSLIRLSCTEIREPTKSAQTVCVQNGFCYPSGPCYARRDVPPHLTLLRYAAALAVAVVATDTASADADRDNGSSSVLPAPRRGRQDGATDRRLAAYSEPAIKHAQHARLYHLLRGAERRGKQPNPREAAGRVAPAGCRCPTLPGARLISRPRSGRYYRSGAT